MTARGVVSKKHQSAILRAQAAAESAERAYRDAIRAAAKDGASIRELAKVTGHTPLTVRRILAGE